MKQMPLTCRAPTDQERKEAQRLAKVLSEAMGDSDFALRLAATSLLVGVLFSVLVIPERRLESFDYFCEVVRKRVQESLT